MLDDVQVLWFDNWYDGPVAGLAEWRGDQYWFNTANDRWYAECPRQFVLLRVPRVDLDREWAIHRDFEESVGTHFCDHLNDDERRHRPNPDEQAFWERHPEEDEDRYRHYPAVGRFALP